MSNAHGDHEANQSAARGAGSPASARAAVGARFAGSIQDLSIPDLIQILQLVGKSAVITVTRDGSDSQLWCADGSIIDAESGPLQGEPALFRILGFDRGWMVADLTRTTRVRRIFASSQHLLLEAARRQDEARLQGLEQQSDAIASENALEYAEPSAALESPASLPPLVAPLHPSWSRPAARAPRGGVWLALAGLALLPVAYLWGAHGAGVFDPAGTAAPAHQAARGSAPQPPESYAVELSVEPASAQILVDGENVAVGHLETSLLRDGRAHTLDIVARGFTPVILFFTDAAPPSHVRLEPLPHVGLEPLPHVGLEPLPAAALPSAAPSPSVAASVRTALQQPARAGVRPRASSGTTAQRVSEPRVQVIGEEPVVRVLD